MATYYNPKIITNNIEFSVDAANVKSWNGPSPIGTDYGYFGAGYGDIGYPGNVSIVDRIDYSNDTATMVEKGPLTVATYKRGAVSSISHGYWGGGQYTEVSTVDRVDYSNDTATASARGPLTSAKWNMCGVGNKDYGYITAGYPGVARTAIDRIDYSNDTPTASSKGQLSGNRYDAGATGTQSYGYIAGGSPQPNGVTSVDRIDYSSDTSTAAAKGPLTRARYGLAATGNASYGYCAAGDTSTPSPSTRLTTVDRIDYASDTSTALVKGPLSQIRYYLAATGNASYGYFGGRSPATSIVDRIDYSNDTPTASTKGPLTRARYGLSATSSRANANPSSESIWKDMTGHGNLTIDGPTFSGLNGGVWDFDGTNDYMEKTSFSGVAFGTGDFAVETWVRVDNLTADHMIWETRSAASSTEDGLVFLAYGSNNDEWSVWTAGASKITGANSSVAADTWYHTIVTRISGTTTLYVNGVSIGSFSDSYNYSNDDLRIGKNVTSANWLNGKISLFRVYKARGFTASEVLNNFNATRTRFGV